MTIAEREAVGEAEWSLLDEMLSNYAVDARAAPRGRDAGALAHEWTDFAELGLLELACGAADDPVLGLFVERMAQAMRSEALVAALGAARLVHTLGEGRHASLLADFARGEAMILPIGLTPRSTPARSRIVARAVSDGYVLNGALPAVEAADCAHWFLVAATLPDDRPGLFLVPADAAGVDRETVRMLDGGHGADVRFSDVPVGVDACLSIDAVASLAAARMRGALLNAAEMLGLMRTLFEDTRDYLSVRQQFGQPIASFQVLRHRIADMHMAIAESRACLYRALHQGAPGFAREPGLNDAAIVMTLRAARLIGREAIQMHGGMGMTDELRVGTYCKRLLMLEQTHGGIDLYLGHIADRLREG